ncbi:efflux RND transporter periplasmic adaptor subunit [Roseomonas populi]|uniref:Efflux RND transporter periplasmic adaptor subunit n=1 Tax=Roseomonas populi TaxID=3121582 RepID=A0ABT1X3I9_9PROT|nr:efflux RND transporter periplasmic adaptor subunit [Roseomonas pecuniae]MCR0982647.1 efflux RND transporter periplasmic adaptor subunit [Roseomonas pecuniae]
MILGLIATASDARAQQRLPVIPLDERGIRSTGIEWAVVESEERAAEIRLPASVSIPPQQLRVVAAPVGGLIEALLVTPDELVRKGQPLARIRSTELLEAQRLFLDAINGEALAREKLRRDEALSRERIIAERRLLVTRAEHVVALTTMQEREQMLALLGMAAAEIAQLRQSRRLNDSVTVHATADGIAMGRDAVPGERVAQSAPLFSLAELDPLWLNIQVPLAAAAALEPGAPVLVPTQGAEGRVLHLSRRADVATQSVSAVAEIDRGAANLRPGQAVVAVLPLRANGSGGQWRVPAGSVVRHRDRSWVFVRRPEGFEPRPVRVLSETPTSVSVGGDLVANDAVATRGILFLLGAMVEREGA